MKTFLLSLALFSIINYQAQAATQNGVTLADTYKLEGKDLTLNGIATRKATWLKVKVYVGGLYLEKKVKSYEELKKLKGPKFITMHFVRDVEKEKLIDGWKEAFQNAFKGKESELKKFSTQTKKLYEIQKSIVKNQITSYELTSKSVKANIAGTETIIEGAGFAEAFLSVWFVNPKDEQLAEGLLGKK